LKKNGLYHIVDKEKNIKSFKILSYGTIKILIILNQLINCSKEENKTILIDEIENGLNLSLIKLLIKSCTNKKINTKNTQLIITTHNPAIIGNNNISELSSFIYFKNKFTNILNLKEIIKRTEDQKSIFKNKNYFNDYF
jgi:AAA15 family ATPase/GTPase